jgi:hypothetical protein
LGLSGESGLVDVVGATLCAQYPNLGMPLRAEPMERVCGFRKSWEREGTFCSLQCRPRFLP